MTALDCWFVIVTVNVDDVPFVSVVALFEHEYWLLVLQTPVHAANAGTTNNDASTIAIASIVLFFTFHLPFAMQSRVPYYFFFAQKANAFWQLIFSFPKAFLF
mgnify:CR=1 FL=1